MAWRNVVRRGFRPTGFGRLIVMAGILAMPLAGARGQSHAPPRDIVADDADLPTRHSVYIPYDHLREVFEREGRGVFLPYEEFEALWRAAYERPSTEPIDYRPPVDAVITETSNEATIERDVVKVKSTVRLELLKPGWNEVPPQPAERRDHPQPPSATSRRVSCTRRAVGYKLLYEHGDATLRARRSPN